MKVFTNIDQSGKLQMGVASIATANSEAYYNEGNLVAATQSAKGLLSAADKTKLDGIATGANKYILPTATSTILGGVKVDTALSTTSTNPVQNKVVNDALNEKADSIHSHTIAQITDFPSSMPASDVYAWAKASTKPSYTASEVGALSLSGGTLTSSNREVLAINSTAGMGPILRLDRDGTNVASIGCIPQSVSNGYGTFINNNDGDIGIVIGVDGKLYRHASVNSLYPRYEILDASNYNSYSPTLTGAGASGTWAIGISGTASYATYLGTSAANYTYSSLVSALGGKSDVGHTHAFSELTSKPTTLSGYGITDGMAKIGRYSGDIDTLYTAGCAYLGNSCSGTFPASGMKFAYGEMLVMSNADTVGQIFVPYAISDYFGKGLYYRGGNTSSKSWNYAWRMCLDDVNYSSYALPLTGGTLTGALTLRGLNTPIVRDFSYNTGQYARSLIDIEQDGSTWLGSIGYMGYASNTFGYFYIGNKEYNGNNLRVYSDKVTWGDSTIYHSGNSNLSTVDWNCYQLNVNANQFYNAETAFVFYSSGRNGFYVAGSPYGFYVATHDSTNNATGNRIIIPPSGTISVYDSVSITGTCYASTGIYTAGYVSARGQDTSSDISLKKDLKPIDNALDYVLGTRYWKFKWKDNDEDCVGIVAQEEREREYGFLVRKHSDKYTYDYAASTALLGAALQEEDNKVEMLRLRIEQLENEIKNLRYGN